MEKSQALAALAALAQDHRLEVFRLLVQVGPGGMPAGTIAAKLDVPNNTLSFHLDRLHAAGLVTSQRQGRQIIYAAHYAVMNGLLAYLTENCCQGQPEHCAPPTCAPVKKLSKTSAKRLERTVS